MNEKQDKAISAMMDNRQSSVVRDDYFQGCASEREVLEPKPTKRLIGYRIHVCMRRRQTTTSVQTRAPKKDRIEKKKFEKKDEKKRERAEEKK